MKDSRGKGVCTEYEDNFLLYNNKMADEKDHLP